MSSSIIFDSDEISGIYESVVRHETKIDSLRNQLNEYSDNHSNANDDTIPLCIACGNAIEHEMGVGYAYRLDSQCFPGIHREYLVCVWCRETILWNEVRQRFLDDTKLSNFELFNEEECEADDD